MKPDNSAYWNLLFATREVGKYPSDSFVRFVAKNFYNVPRRESVNFLELGCGTGPNLWYLAREGFRVYGIDFSETAIAQVKSRLESEDLSEQIGELVLGDYVDQMEHLPNSFFDAIIDVESLYANSFAKAKVIIESSILKLKPGGLFYSQTFSDKSWGFEGEDQGYHQVIPIEGPSANTGLCRYTTESDIKLLYEASNLKVQSTIRNDLHLESGEVISEWIIVSKKL